jgi:ribosomal protein S18 acetylase RimI-like enzyme
MIHIQPAEMSLSSAVEPILRALPQWFGIEQATQTFIQAADANPTILAVDTDRANQPIGFLTLRCHSAAAAEVYVIGVLPEYHRRSVGRALIMAAEKHLRAMGVRFLQVKTLSDRHPDVNYQKTRAFYLAMGFCLLEDSDMWGPQNPCWQLIKML